MLVVLGSVLPGALLIGSIAKRTLDDNRHVIVCVVLHVATGYAKRS